MQSDQEKIELIVTLLGNQWKNSAIKTALCEQYQMDDAAAEMCLVEAQKLLLAKSKIPREELIAKLLAGYENIVADPQATPNDRNRALDSIREMFVLTETGNSSDDLLKLL
jgi:hypothetical protein